VRALDTPQHDCRLWISATDYHMARIGSQSTTGFGGEAAARVFCPHGLTDPDQPGSRSGLVRATTPTWCRACPPVPPPHGRGNCCIGGHAWRCIAGYGHAPEHMALYCPALGVLISGDMVLPRISTNVSVYDQEPEADALTLFLARWTSSCPCPNTLVLPSHGKPFTGLHERIQQLQDHHADRLAEVLEACRPSPAAP
jgi:glyoxylase-like metal-dependent hydrolase (beta-lactamase superfamily II)